jgi:hypothetical protein
MLRGSTSCNSSRARIFQKQVLSRSKLLLTKFDSVRILKSDFYLRSGGHEFPNRGVYLKVVKNERLVFTDGLRQKHEVALVGSRRVPKIYSSEK